MNPSRSIAAGNPDSRARFLMWTSLWGGGIAWSFHLLAVWAFAEFGCIGALSDSGPLGWTWVAWAVVAATIIFIGLACLAIFASVVCRRRLDGDDARFVARYGVAANPLFLLIIIAQSLPVFFYLNDCGSYILL